MLATGEAVKLSFSLSNGEPHWSSANASLSRLNMKYSPSTGASAAGPEDKSPALPSTPWAELDPGEQGEERFDALGNRVEDSSDEEDREQEERDGVLDEENTEVTHSAAFYRRSCVTRSPQFSEWGAGAAARRHHTHSRLRDAQRRAARKYFDRISLAFDTRWVGSGQDAVLIKSNSVANTSRFKTHAFFLPLETSNRRRLRLFEDRELTSLLSFTTWGSPSGRRKLKFLKGSAYQRYVRIDTPFFTASSLNSLCTFHV